MSTTDTCKRTTELTIPAADVAAEVEKVVLAFQKRTNMPGFRPGKAPLGFIKKNFHQDIRQQVVENLVPKAFRAKADAEQWQVAGNPNVTEIKMEDGEPLWFKADFEVAPVFELGEYRGLEAPYLEPKVEDSEVESRMTALRDSKAEYVNIDPRPLADGDHAVVSLQSVEGVEGEPVTSDETVLEIGGAQTVAAFSEALRGREPGDEMDVEVEYPEDYSHNRLAGRKVKFHLTVKGLRRKELPELNDEFAKDAGDFQGLEELRSELRRQVLREREGVAQSIAKNALVDTLVNNHQFPVPDSWVNAQMQSNVEGRLRELAGMGADLSKLELDWEKVREHHGERAQREVKAALILGKIAEREAIETMTDEVDREVHRLARQMREPAAAVRMRLQKDGSIDRIASRIRTDKVLNFLFEQSRKVDPPPPSEPAEAPAAE